MFNKIIILLLLVCSSAYANQATSPYIFDNPQDEARFYELTNELRCLVCQNQTLLDSDAPLAKNLREEVYAQVLAKKSNADIIAYLTTRYGEFILYQPPVQPSTWVLWFGPLVLFLLVIGVLIIIMRRAQQRYKKGEV